MAGNNWNYTIHKLDGKSTLTVTVTPSTRFKVRLWIANKLIHLIGWILPQDVKAEMNWRDNDEKEN